MRGEESKTNQFLAMEFWRRANFFDPGNGSTGKGILGAAFHDPVWTSAVLSSRDFVLALAGFLLLLSGRCRPGSPSSCWQPRGY